MVLGMLLSTARAIPLEITTYRRATVHFGPRSVVPRDQPQRGIGGERVEHDHP
jgi:hypothetical protein